jgi:uncharacterized membrane protein YfcA
MTLALGAGGLVKGATGMGLPLIATPILAAFLGVPHAVAVMSLPILFTNTWQVWTYWADLRTLDFLPPMLLTGAVGTVLGTWLLAALPEKALALALAVLLIAYVVLRLRRPDLSLTRRRGRRLAPGMGAAAGLLQGATGISSPIAVTFIHGMRLSRTAHVGAVSAVFLALGIVHVPALAAAGILDGPRLLQGLFAILPALALMPLGAWLASRLSQKAFDRVILGLLGVIAAELLHKALGT